MKPKELELFSVTRFYDMIPCDVTLPLRLLSAYPITITAGEGETDSGGYGWPTRHTAELVNRQVSWRDVSVTTLNEAMKLHQPPLSAGTFWSL